MNYSKTALRNIAVIGLLACFVIACDKDFATVESDIINTNNATNFETASNKYDVISYTKALPPIQTNNLPVNLLGIYDDPLYGKTTASFVTQLSTSFVEPDFGQNTVLDSVVITIPYFSTATGLDEDGNTEYELDSIFGDSSYKLSLYESNYFLRDFEPNSDINDPQIYYSNKTTSTGSISDAVLEGTLIRSINSFIPENKQIILTDTEGEITERQPPALRMVFKSGTPEQDAELEYWKEKIIDKSGEPEISNQSNLNDYFRGLYFKAEFDDDITNNFAILNLTSNDANVTLHYTRDNTLNNDEPIQSTFTFNFVANRVNFLSNDFTLSDGDPFLGDERLFLKGGEGSLAMIKLFDGENIDNDNNINSFELFKNDFVETDENGNFIRSKKLVNEANLVFYVDKDAVQSLVEPERIYIYDTKNNSPLIDYFFDSASTLDPINSRTAHLGRLEEVDNTANGGEVEYRYKIRITEHINNILVRDSSNVDLGLVVSGNINLESNAQDYDILNPEDDNDKLPVSSIITQRGTVLFGNNAMEEGKRLYLEIFFTEPNN